MTRDTVRAFALLASVVTVATAQPPAYAADEPVLYTANKSLTDYRRNDPQKTWDWLARQIDSVPGKPGATSSPASRKAYSEALDVKMRNVRKLAFVTSCGDVQYQERAGLWEVSRTVFGLDINSRPSVDVLPVSTVSEAVIETGHVAASTYQAGDGKAMPAEKADTYAIVFASALSNGPLATAKIFNQGSPEERTVLRAIFPMEPEKADEIRDRIVCAHLMTLRPPYLFTYSKVQRPTVTNPVQHESRGHAFYGTLDKIVIFNAATGEVYEKMERWVPAIGPLAE